MTLCSIDCLNLLKYIKCDFFFILMHDYHKGTKKISDGILQHFEIIIFIIAGLKPNRCGSNKLRERERIHLTNRLKYKAG